MNSGKESSAMTEVRMWKSEANKEVEDLRIRNAIRHRLKTSLKTMLELGFQLAEISHSAASDKRSA